MSDAAEIIKNSKVLQQNDDCLQITTFNCWDDLGDYSVAWSELVARAESATIFQTFEWHDAWWRAFGSRYELWVTLCHKGERLVGIAPLLFANGTNEFGAKARELRFIGCPNNSSDYLEFIVDPDCTTALAALLNEIDNVADEFNQLVLSHYPTHFSSHDATIAILQNRGVNFAIEFEQEAPCRVLHDKEQDIRATRKSSLRRRFNYFNKSGELRFVRCSSALETFEFIDRFFEQHIARRAVTTDPSQFQHDAQQRFYRNLVDRMSGKWLMFDVVLFDERPIAFHFGFAHKNKFYWYKPTFDIGLAKHSPGEVLIKYLLENAIEDELEEFDFTVGSESFKFRFSNTIRQNNRITVYNSFMDYQMHLAKQAARRLIRAVRGLVNHRKS